jgi:hypothetical protein
MSDTRAETRARVEIDGHAFLVDLDRDLVELMQQIEAAARSQPTFVHLHGGEGSVSVLVTPRSKIVITVDHGRRAVLGEESPLVPTSDWEL